MKALLELLKSSSQSSPEAAALYYDELANLVMSSTLDPQVQVRLTLNFNILAFHSNIYLPCDFAELQLCSTFSLLLLLSPCRTQETIADLVLKDFEDDFVVEIETKIEGSVGETWQRVEYFIYFLFFCRTWLIKSFQCRYCTSATFLSRPA